jgi:hypothetical protein
MKAGPALLLIGWTCFPQPPKDLRQGAAAVVYGAPSPQVATLWKANPQDRVIACAEANSCLVVTPNSCDLPIEGDARAQLMCQGLSNGSRH